MSTRRRGRASGPGGSVLPLRAMARNTSYGRPLATAVSVVVLIGVVAVTVLR